MRVTVGKKISGGFLIVNIMVILMSIFAYFEVGLINSSYETAMDTNLERIGIVQEFSAALANEAVAIRRYNASGDAADQAMYKDYKRKTDAGITKLEERIHTDSGKNRIQLIKTNKSEYETNADKSIEARKNNNLEQAGVFMQEAGKPYKLAIANTEELVNDVTLSVNSDKAKQSENARHIQLVLIVVNILVTVVATGIGLFISRSIANPIRRITVTADEIAKGNLNQPDILVNSSDEISEVAQSFNIMKNNLKDLLKKIASATDHVAASSQQLTASSEQSADATNQVAGTISEVALGAESQASAADLAYQAVVQLTEHIQQVAKNAGEVSGVAEKTSLAATQGDSAVNAAIEQMETIEHTVANSAQIVKKLGDSSQEIGQIVSTIAGISGQTNLLALNAAIEAARAGEQGRGFAVVAEEVRKLAEQSQEAAKQIADLINAIQSDTDQAVEAMNAGAHEVKTGAEVVNNAGRAFKEIVSLIEEVTSQIRKITTAIQQMNSGSEQIVHSVRDIERISKVAAGQTQTVAAATEEQSASIEEIAASSQALARVADELQQAVAIFKVATE